MTKSTKQNDKQDNPEALFPTFGHYLESDLSVEEIAADTGLQPATVEWARKTHVGPDGEILRPTARAVQESLSDLALGTEVALLAKDPGE